MDSNNETISNTEIPELEIVNIDGPEYSAEDIITIENDILTFNRT